MTARCRPPARAAGLCALLAAAGTQAADLRGYVVVTSDYVFRGVTYSDDHAAVRGGLDLSLDSGWFGGVWASTIDIGNTLTQRDTEINYYAGYSHDLNADWSLGVNVVAYTYPGATGPIDYDYREYSAVVNFRDRAWLEYSYSPDLFHSGRATHHVAAYGEWPLPGRLLLGIGAGYYDTGKLTAIGYGYWQAGITRPFRRFSIDLRYHDTNREVPIVSYQDRAGSRIALGLRLPFAIAGD